MNYYEFIFSDQRKYRVRRHVVFWVTWCFYFALLYLVPFAWIPSWDLNGPRPQIEEYGWRISILRILMNSILMTMVHMALAYGILYYFLPRYLSKNKNKITTTLLLFVFVILIACFNYLNFLATFAISNKLGFFQHQGISNKMPGMDFIIPIWLRQIIFNYPTVVGLTLGIKLLKRWYLKQKETEELASEKINAELQLLKAQVHPHFLFNTLNNIYSFILNKSPHAPEMIKKLRDLLYYILNDCNRPLVPLESEIILLQDYIALERIRYGDKLNLNLQIEGNPSGKMIAPLLLIPFVENSFKHGTSQMLTHPWIKLDLVITGNLLQLSISNNRPHFNTTQGIKKGIGLTNVKKRLRLLYPGTHSLEITESEMTYDVILKIALDTNTELVNIPPVTQKEFAYELA